MQNQNYSFVSNWSKNSTFLLSSTPKRIISLVPSITELLFDFQLYDEVVGITNYCIHPKNYVSLCTKIGGTKRIKIEKIKTIHPDLIIANIEENEKNQIEELQQYFPVWLTNVKTINDSFLMIKELGQLLLKEKIANQIIKKIRQQFQNLNKINKKVVYIIWKEPLMTVGNDTFIHDVLSQYGLENIFKNENRYPIITVEQIKKLNPDLIMLSSEPYPFKEKHVKEFIEIFTNCKTILVDGEMFSWYGSRMLNTQKYCNKLIQKIELY